MLALWIILGIIGVAFDVFIRIIFGRICAEIIKDKNPNMNEVLWFWAGVALTFITVLLTLCVKSKDKE